MHIPRTPHASLMRPSHRARGINSIFFLAQTRPNIDATQQASLRSLQGIPSDICQVGATLSPSQRLDHGVVNSRSCGCGGRPNPKAVASVIPVVHTGQGQRPPHLIPSQGQCPPHLIPSQGQRPPPHLTNEGGLCQWTLVVALEQRPILVAPYREVG